MDSKTRLTVAVEQAIRDKKTFPTKDDVTAYVREIVDATKRVSMSGTVRGVGRGRA